MITAIQAFCDAHDSGSLAVADEWRNAIPAWQIVLRFDDLASRCPYRLDLGVPPRKANALNVEVGQGMPRCRLRTPEHWGDADQCGARWIGSGGHLAVFGMCSCSGCPIRTRNAQKGTP